MNGFVCIKGIYKEKFKSFPKTDDDYLRSQTYTELSKQTDHRKQQLIRGFKPLKKLKKAEIYATGINETLRKQLKLSNLYDEISTTDIAIKNEINLQEHHVMQHEKFVSNFENFLIAQHDRTKEMMQQLHQLEQSSTDLRNDVVKLNVDITKQCLRIYELESAWRNGKTVQNFVQELQFLQDEQQTYTPFRPEVQLLHSYELKPKGDQSSFDKMIKIFYEFNTELPFHLTDYDRISVSRIGQLFGTFKRQNYKLLNENLLFQSSHTFRDKVHPLLTSRNKGDQNDNSRSKKQTMKDPCTTTVRSEKSSEVITIISHHIEKLYLNQFHTKRPEITDFEMSKCLERYCISMMIELDSYDPRFVHNAKISIKNLLPKKSRKI